MIAAHCKNADCVYNLVIFSVFLVRPDLVCNLKYKPVGWIFHMGDKYNAFLKQQRKKAKYLDHYLELLSEKWWKMLAGL